MSGCKPQKGASSASFGSRDTKRTGALSVVWFGSILFQVLGGLFEKGRGMSSYSTSPSQLHLGKAKVPGVVAVGLVVMLGLASPILFPVAKALGRQPACPFRGPSCKMLSSVPKATAGNQSEHGLSSGTHLNASEPGQQL